MDKQTIFNIVRNHLLKQGGPCRKSTEDGGTCLYRHGDKTCSIGALMAHVGMYSKDWEDLTVINLYNIIHGLGERAMSPEAKSLAVKFFAAIGLEESGDDALIPWTDGGKIYSPITSRKYDIDFLYRLQQIHDAISVPGCVALEYAELSYKQLAVEYGLEIVDLDDEWTPDQIKDKGVILEEEACLTI